MRSMRKTVNKIITRKSKRFIIRTLEWVKKNWFLEWKEKCNKRSAGEEGKTRDPIQEARLLDRHSWVCRKSTGKIESLTDATLWSLTTLYASVVDLPVDGLRDFWFKFWRKVDNAVLTIQETYELSLESGTANWMRVSASNEVKYEEEKKGGTRIREQGNYFRRKKLLSMPDVVTPYLQVYRYCSFKRRMSVEQKDNYLLWLLLHKRAIISFFLINQLIQIHASHTFVTIIYHGSNTR